MSNAGIFPGLPAPAWKSYRPRLRAFETALGDIAQPVLSDPRYVIGRYLITNQGIVKGQAQITFQSADTFDTAGSVWGISLPFPASRSSGGADLPIGNAFLWQGAAANPSPVLIGQVTLMDPLEPGGSQGNEDNFAQVFLSSLVAFGTATITSAATSVTVTHGLASGFTPNAYDIHLVPTNSPTTNPQWWSVQNIGATTFDIVVKTAPSTSGATFSWKIDAFPNSSSEFALLLNRQKPWTWAAGHQISINFEYEARR